MDRDDEARAVLERLLAAPIHNDWEPEDKEFKARARTLLEKLR
jgi:hypothetical protein